MLAGTVPKLVYNTVCDMILADLTCVPQPCELRWSSWHESVLACAVRTVATKGLEISQGDAGVFSTLDRLRFV